MSLSSFTIPTPDDWHLHLRDDATLKAVLPYTARHFARAIVMPNLVPPLVMTEQTKAYRERILQALPEGLFFTPLMTAYLTDSTQPDDLARGFMDGIFFAAKLYPAGVTTNAENGVTDIQAIVSVLDLMQRLEIPLLIHGEVTNPEIDFFDREAVFIDQVLIPLRRSFPELKIVLEHITTRHAVQYVASESQNGKLAATITAHHLLLNRNALFEGGIHPHHFCLPILKSEDDRLSLVEAATSGASMFFAGTDSAPHPRTTKESACGAGGIFSAPSALGIYAEIFEKEDALPRLEDFLSMNGPAFYGLPVNAGTLTLEKGAGKVLNPILTEKGTEIIPFPPSSSWHVKEKQPL